jgi:hypothetical protein
MITRRASFNAVMVVEGTDLQAPTLMAIEAWAKSKGVTIYVPMQSGSPVVVRVDLEDMENPK